MRREVGPEAGVAIAARSLRSLLGLQVQTVLCRRCELPVWVGARWVVNAAAGLCLRLRCSPSCGSLSWAFIHGHGIIQGCRQRGPGGPGIVLSAAFPVQLPP